MRSKICNEVPDVEHNNYLFRVVLFYHMTVIAYQNVCDIKQIFKILKQGR